MRANREVGTHEVDADGGNVALLVRVVREAQEEAGLADARVADQEQLKQVVTADGGA